METNITATLGAGALIFNNEQVLLVQMNYGPAKGGWILPGGMVSLHEHPHEAAIRETKEETGLDINIVGQVAVRSRRFTNGNSNIYWVFRGQLTTPFHGQPFSFNQDELSDVRFWDINTAVQADEIRPMTRLYIEMGSKQELDHSWVANPKEQNTDDHIYGVPYE